MSLNKTMLIGRIGKDAEIKDFGNNQVINFSVATTEVWYDKNKQKQEKTTWFEVAKWGNNTSLAQYLTKGTQVYVEGKVEADAYVNNQGEAKSVLRLNAFNIQLLGSRNDNQTKAPDPVYQARPTGAFELTKENENEDDLPF